MSTIRTSERFTALPDPQTLVDTVVALEEHRAGVDVVEDPDAAREAVLVAAHRSLSHRAARWHLRSVRHSRRRNSRGSWPCVRGAVCGSAYGIAATCDERRTRNGDGDEC